MKHLDLFSGIGGFSMGLQKHGIQTVAFCEKDKACQQVLKNNWAHVPIISDIRLLNGIEFKNRYGNIDILTAGVPCQPASLIGKRKGNSDSRWLWPDTLRVIEEIQPEWVICENPPGILTLNQGNEFTKILKRLEQAGYVIWWETIPATAVGASHRRERVWIIAYSSSKRLEGHTRNAEIKRQKKSNRSTAQETIFPVRDTCRWWQDKSPVPIVVNGVSDPSLWKEQIIATGNAVVPQVVEIIGRAIMEIENGCPYI